MNINSLPIELFLEILTNTDGKTLGKCRRVCKKWKTIIDTNDIVWKIVCLKEYEHPSNIAKEKCHNDCTWYNIYKNLTCWSNVTNYNMKMRDFYEFPVQELSRNFSVTKEMKSLIGIHCTKIANNRHALVIYFKSALIIVRPVDRTGYLTEKFYRAGGFSLWGKYVYFYRDLEVHKVDLESKELDSNQIYICPYKILEIQHYKDMTYLFTQCGHIFNFNNNTSNVKPIKCPQVWLPQIKHISAINDKNYICYSRNLFNIETDKYRHLYLEFPQLTSLFFYGDFVIIGMRTGDLWVYRLSSQKRAVKPVFEYLTKLPEGQYPIQIDVVERKSGPVVIIITLFKVYFLEIDFFEFEKDDELPLSMKRLTMYKRLLAIRDANKGEISS